MLTIKYIKLRLTPDHIKLSFPQLFTPSTSITLGVHSIYFSSLAPIALPKTAILTLIYKQVQLRATQLTDGMKISLALLANTPLEIVQKHIITLSHDIWKDQLALADMKTFMKINHNELFQVKQLPLGVSPTETFPSEIKMIYRQALVSTTQRVFILSKKKKLSQITVLL